jgi:regulator of replication initiation timing
MNIYSCLYPHIHIFRQFSIAKDDTTKIVQELGEQLKDLLQANRELRAENERLRNIY